MKASYRGQNVNLGSGCVLMNYYNNVDANYYNNVTLYYLRVTRVISSAPSVSSLHAHHIFHIPFYHFRLLHHPSIIHSFTLPLQS